MRFRFIIYIILVAAQCVFSQTPEYSHHISRAFHVSSPVTVEVSNKYGRIQVIPWDKDSVRFDIDLRIRAKDRQKLEKIRQNIEIEFTPIDYFIIAETKFGNTGSDVLKEIVEIAGSYIPSSNSVSINYIVRIPSHLNLKIENKFGDVYLADHSGSLNMILSYGNFKANRLNGRTDLKISNGDADINYIKEGTGNFNYANVHMRESSMLSVQSQSSVIRIDKSGNIKLNSRRDKIYLNEANYVSGETYFTIANIGKLNNSATLSGRYGDLIIDDVRRSFTSININSELTDISLSFERPMVFDFDLTYNQSVLFTYPRTLAHFSTNESNKEEKLFITTGYFGSGSSSSRVNIKALRKCNLTISQR